MPGETPPPQSFPHTLGKGFKSENPSMISQNTIIDKKDNSISLKLHNDSRVNWNMNDDS